MLTNLLAGNVVYCNICEKGFISFVNHMYRPNVCCPNCHSLERTRKVWYYLNHKKLISKDNLSKSFIALGLDICDEL